MSSPHGALPAHREAHDPYAALRLRDVRLYLMGSFLAAFGLQVQTAAVFWQIYERTGSKLQIAFVGLVQVIPVIALTLPAGYLADRLNRKHLVILSLAVIGCCSLGLAVFSLFDAPIGWMYVFLFGTGVARSLQQPAKSALFPQLVPREHFTNAVTWGTSTYQFASITGPAVCGGLLWWFAEPAIAYFLSAIAAFVFTLLLGTVNYRFTPTAQTDSPVREVIAGAKFVWSAKVVLGATALDMFAVLLGGAEALFSVYANDILFAGPIGYGAMLAAQPVGALCMSFVQSHRRPFDHAGIALLWSVVGFGLTTIGFGLSTSLPFSLFMLVLMGACDNVSVVLRHTLVQMLTPDAMRGRVSAINSMFISISNELGGFESGAVAHWTSPIFAVVTGGLGTILVAALAAVGLPELRRYQRSAALRAEREDSPEEIEAAV
ncbi:MAG: MFS transporter [Planctomycetia bacterium]|nr:MFS transporter [Planctomycetia bacterium]